MDTWGPSTIAPVYLRYQDLPHHNTTFEIDDGALTENGFARCNAYPMKFTGDTPMLTSTNPLCIKVYSDILTNHRLVVGLGQSFGKSWIYYVVADESNSIPGITWGDYTFGEYHKMRVGALDPAQAMNSKAQRCGQVCIMQTRLPRTAWNWMDSHHLDLYKPLMLSLPSNDNLKSLLTSFSTRLTNRYLVTSVIQCPPDPFRPGSNITTPLYSVAKPFVWFQSESVGCVRRAVRRQVVR